MTTLKALWTFTDPDLMAQDEPVEVDIVAFVRGANGNPIAILLLPNGTLHWASLIDLREVHAK